MNEFVIPLNHPDCGDANICGHKASSLNKLIARDIEVPEGICLSKDVYRNFIVHTGIREQILVELSRKNFQTMRWEELWDASLRIRNIFAKAVMPENLKKPIESAIGKYFPNMPVVIRSSSNFEDSPVASFAGIHESFVNIKSIENILHHIKLVWASLWSDAALSYQKELSLDVDKSAMAVIVQKIILGEKSGIAFSLNPNDNNQAVIEAVFGLNKGLVDGDIEPDRWILNRRNGQLISQFTAQDKKYCVPRINGVKIIQVPIEKKNKSVLNQDEVDSLYKTIRKIEILQQSPQDIEWTMHEKLLYLLQSRPITTRETKDPDTRRSWDLTLRKSYENLKNLSHEIENVWIPAMIKETDLLSKKKLTQLTDKELKKEIKVRKQTFDKWNNIYWDEFIPFGHGVRLFGEIYNNRLIPADPYEFIDLITSDDLKSVERNKMLENLAIQVQKNPNLLSKKDYDDSHQITDIFLEKFEQLSCDINQCRDERETLMHVIREMAKKPIKRKSSPDKKILLKRYLEAFDRDEQDFARDILGLAKKSYRLRDDDNIYLGRFETLFNQALEEFEKRKFGQCKKNGICKNIEEALREIKLPYNHSKKDKSFPSVKNKSNFRPRQLRGQPAGKGIAKGYARVIKNASDLTNVKQGEILVCDAIDPNMTFVIPLVKGIVERRGGMLIHGAIIAREYGLPCVTGIPKATLFIKTGDLITVDGYFGLVIIHRKNQNASKSKPQKIIPFS